MRRASPLAFLLLAACGAASSQPSLPAGTKADRLLVDKSETLNHQAFRFRRQTRSLRQAMWLQNFKFVLCGVLVLALVGLFVAILVCGLDFSKCRAPPAPPSPPAPPPPSPSPPAAPSHCLP